MPKKLEAGVRSLRKLALKNLCKINSELFAFEWYLNCEYTAGLLEKLVENIY